MRVGFLMRYDPGRIAFAREHGCTSASLLIEPDDPFMPPHAGWQTEAQKLAEAFEDAELVISSLGSMYKNMLDPSQTAELSDFVRSSVELAGELGVDTIGCFAGRVMDQPLEKSLPAFKSIWGNLARFAGDRGVRIAFENCPHGPFFQPPGGNNFMCTPEMWERAFTELALDNVGLQWDPSHLVCLFIDPVENLRRFGSKVFHVHAKDARVDRANLARYGIWHPDTLTHCFPGLGECHWQAIVAELKAQGYDGALDIEGWHDPVYRDEREDEGLEMAIKFLKKAARVKALTASGIFKSA